MLAGREPPIMKSPVVHVSTAAATIWIVDDTLSFSFFYNGVPYSV